MPWTGRDGNAKPLGYKTNNAYDANDIRENVKRERERNECGSKNDYTENDCGSKND